MLQSSAASPAEARPALRRRQATRRLRSNSEPPRAAQSSLTASPVARRQQEPLCDSDIIVARVQAPDNRLRALHVVRRAGRSQRRDLLQLRPAEPGTVGVRSRPARARRRPRLRAVRHRHVRRPLHPHARVFRRKRRHGRPVQQLLAQQPGALPVWRQRGSSRLRRRTLVDGPERRLAARRLAPHLHEHDGAAAARAVGSRGLRSPAAW